MFFELILKKAYETAKDLLEPNDILEIDFGGVEFPPYTITLYKNVLILNHNILILNHKEVIK